MTGSGAPSTSLSATVSGTAVQRFNAAGAGVKTLSAVASGAAVQKFNATGAGVKTLSAVASGAAVQKFSGAGAGVKTLSAVASGTAVQRFNAVGPGIATLSAFGSGTATNTPDVGVSQPVFIIGGEVEVKKRRKKKKPLELEAQETPDPVFEPLPEIEPTRRVAWAKIGKTGVNMAKVINTAKVNRRRRQEQELIQMIMAGAA